MRKWTFLITTWCFLAQAGAALAQPEIDCKSAAPPPMDVKTYRDICRSRAVAERAASGRTTLAAAAAAATVFDSRKTVAGLSFANVPTWSDADILTQFSLTRDKRYMTMPEDPSFQRRIPWMYPENLAGRARSR